MRVFQSAKQLNTTIQKLKSEGVTIGFVPTMGALHEGHMSLIRAAKEASDYVVASIFVNPTQFNESSDLKKYPKTPTSDKRMLQLEGCDLVFMPSVDDVYPDGEHKEIDLAFGDLDKVMEGAHRPGHFAGVAAVVKRLLDIVEPDGLYMGQKDFQQTAIIQHMISHFELPTKLVICPTMREIDGLAMSSRNRRLTKENRAIAPIIHKVLQEVKEAYLDEYDVVDIEQIALEALTNAGFRPEYLSIADGVTLQAIRRKAGHNYVVVCVAAWAGSVRLIDNVIIKAL